MARLRDILGGCGPAELRNILKQYTWFHKAENVAQLQGIIRHDLVFQSIDNKTPYLQFLKGVGTVLTLDL